MVWSVITFARVAFARLRGASGSGVALACRSERMVNAIWRRSNLTSRTRTVTAVAGADDFFRIFDEPIGELRDVTEPVLVDPDVDEGSEVGNVGDDAGADHARREVFELVNVLSEGERREGLARSRPGFSSSFTTSSNVNARDLSRSVRAALTFWTPGPRKSETGTPRRSASFSRPGSVRDARPCCRADVKLRGRAKSRPPARTPSVKNAALSIDRGVSQKVPSRNDIRRWRARARGPHLIRVARGDGSGVEVDADLVDARVDDVVEALLQCRWRDVMLVLSDADALRVDLDELGERILKAPRDRNGAADRDVELGNSSRATSLAL